MMFTEEMCYSCLKSAFAQFFGNFNNAVLKMKLMKFDMDFYPY